MINITVWKMTLPNPLMIPLAIMIHSKIETRSLKKLICLWVHQKCKRVSYSNRIGAEVWFFSTILGSESKLFHRGFLRFYSSLFILNTSLLILVESVCSGSLLTDGWAGDEKVNTSGTVRSVKQIQSIPKQHTTFTLLCHKNACKGKAFWYRDWNIVAVKRSL